MIEYADVVIAHSEITFSWMDRVKILLNGKRVFGFNGSLHAVDGTCFRAA